MVIFNSYVKLPESKLGHNFDFESIGTPNYLVCIHPYGQIMMFNVEEIQRSLKFEDAARCVKNGPPRFCGLNSLVVFFLHFCLGWTTNVVGLCRFGMSGRMGFAHDISIVNGFNLMFVSIPKNCCNPHVYPLVNVYIANWNITMLSMGKIHYFYGHVQ